MLLIVLILQLDPITHNPPLKACVPKNVYVFYIQYIIIIHSTHTHFMSTKTFILQTISRN